MPWVSLSRTIPARCLLLHASVLRRFGSIGTAANILSSSSSSGDDEEYFSSSGDDTVLDAFQAAVSEFSKHRCPPAVAAPSCRHPSAYNALMTSLSRSGDADEVLRLFREFQASNPVPNALCYNTAINALVVAGRHGDARELFDEMVASGVEPTTSSYTILIKMLCFHPSLIDRAYGIIQKMTCSNCPPDAITYSTLIIGLCRAGRIEEALGVLDLMQEEKLPPTVESYTCIVHGYCSEGRIEEAKRLICMMERVECPPDVVTYSVLIEALCRFGYFDEVDRILRESKVKSWKPNEITYNIYMNGLCKAGKVDEAFLQLEIMRRKGLRPTIITLAILYDCLCRDSRVWEAKFLLKKSAQLEWEIDVFFYNILMSRLCDNGEWIGVLKLLTDMLKKGISPDTCSFTIVIRSLCKAGMLHRAKCIFISRGFVIDVIAFNTLLHGFYVAKEFNEVLQLYSDMTVNNVLPNKFTFGIMIDTLCTEGKYFAAIDFLLEKSLKDGLFPDLVIRLNNWLVKCGKLGVILHLLQELSTRGLYPDVLIFNSMIRAFCRNGYCQRRVIYRLCIILDTMLEMK